MDTMIHALALGQEEDQSVDRPALDLPVTRNVVVSGRRTSVRMEVVMWRSLMDICDREDLTLNDVCTMVDQVRGETGLTAALRVLIVAYYRALHSAFMRATMASGSAGQSGLFRAAMASFDEIGPEIE